MSEVSILKLRDGTTLVGKVTSDGEMINIEHPIEVVPTTGMLQQGILGEHISLRPWIALAEQQTFTIERYNVITIASLQDAFHRGYHDMVENIYVNDPQWAGSFINESELLEEIRDDLRQRVEDMEEEASLSTEYADAKLNKKIH
tara:strand:- start:541 stop:975 length:435 start_codon:yes stop_codon:yes gene_type:complete